MKETIASVNDIVWGAPTLLLILGVGLYLTWHLRFAQIRFLPESLRRFVQQFLPCIVEFVFCIVITLEPDEKSADAGSFQYWAY